MHWGGKFLGDAVKGISIAICFGLVVAMTGCAGTQATATGVSVYHLAPGEKFVPRVDVAKGVGVDGDGFTTLQKRLTSRLKENGLLGRAGDPQSRTLEVIVTNYVMRNDRDRVVAGILAGTDNIQSTVTITDTSSGTVVSQFNVQTTNDRAWGLTNELIDKHAYKILDVLYGAKR